MDDLLKELNCRRYLLLLILNKKKCFNLNSNETLLQNSPKDRNLIESNASTDKLCCWTKLLKHCSI